MTRIIFLVILTITLFPIHSYARENSGKLIFRKKFNKFTTSIESDYRYNEDELNHRHYDIGIQIPFTDGWSASINYRLVYKFKDNNNKWELEKRPHISLQKVFNTKLVKVEFRTRQEYRYRADKTESTRNRTRIMLKSNKEIFKLKPFIGNEVFYNMDKEKYNKNWLVGGVSFPKSNFGNYSVYYKHVTDLDEDDWNSEYSIILKAIYKF
jgi:hypothetical protein